MRYAGCDDYFSLYTQNPKVVNMLVLFNSLDLVEGRALVWKCRKVVENEDITLMDRIYVTDDNYVQLFRSYAEKHSWYYKYKDGQSYKTECMCPPNYDIEVNLKLEAELDTEWDKYPYVDTFTYCDNGVLSNRDNGCERTLDETDGGPNDEYDTVYSEWHDRDIPEDESVYSATLQDYILDDESVNVLVGKNWDNMPKDHDYIVRINGTYYHAETSCNYSEYEGEWILAEDSVWLEYIGDYVSPENTTYSEFEQSEILNDDSIYSEYHESYMLKSKCKNINGDWIHEDYEDEYLESIKEEEDAEVTFN